MKNITLLSLSALLFLASCGKSPKAASAEPESEATPVEITSIRSEDINNPIMASGVVTSENDAKPAFKTGGVIDKVYFKEGDFVSKGQLMATLNLTEISAQVQQATEAVTKAERDLKRVQNLHNDSVATLEQLQNAGTGVEVAKQTLAIANFNKSYSEIHAPISGKVIQRMMGEGEVVGPGMPVFYILGNGTADWVIKVGLADRDWARLHVGDRAKVRLDAYPGEVFEANVSKLADVGNPMSGTFDAELSIKANGRKLAAGLVAAVEIVPQAQGAKPVIPIECLVESNGTSGSVFVLDANGVVHKTTVGIAYLSNDKVVLSSAPTGNVVTTGAQFLRDGQKVRVVE